MLLGSVESVLIGFLWFLREDRAAKEEEGRVTRGDLEEHVSLMNQLGGEDGGNAAIDTIKDDNLEMNSLS